MKELIHLLVDNVSKNANLLLNVGPKADGTIPEIQKNLLHGMGEWLNVNGDAIYETRAWFAAEAKTTAGDELRFTWKDGTLYLMLMNEVDDKKITIPGILLDEDAEISMLLTQKVLDWTLQERNLTIELPEEMPGQHVFVITISGNPGYLMRR